MLVEGIRRLPISSKAFGPPKGIIPDMKSWVDEYKTAHPTSECWYRKIHDAVEIHRPPARSVEEVPPMFLEEQKLQQPEIFVASIPQPRLLSESGMIISPDDRAFAQSCVWKTRFFTRDIEYNTLRPKLKPSRLPGEYITLIARHSASYYHWFTETLPRLWLLDSLPDAPLLLPTTMKEYQRESLALLGIPSERVVELPEGCYELDQLYFPSFPAYATFTTDWTFSASDRSLRWLREKLSGKRLTRKEKRIYISREGVAHRRIINEDSVMRALEGEGFLIVDANPLSLSEKINLFGDASFIVGAHGAGLTHMLFAAAGAKVVEGLDPFHLVGGLYYQLAAALGHEYWYLFAENQAWKSATPLEKSQNNREWPFQAGPHDLVGSRKGFDDLVVPVDLLLRTIEAAEVSTQPNMRMSEQKAY